MITYIDGGSASYFVALFSGGLAGLWYAIRVFFGKLRSRKGRLDSQSEMYEKKSVA